MANILAVDDSASIRHLVLETLKSAKHRVAGAEDGNAALVAAAKERFDLVITDVNMPGMDGLTLVQKLRALPAYRTVPILILSTEMDPEKKKIAKNSGATGWLVKPFDPVQLLAVIRKVID
jgi:two-component system, chemotaxis family, chemotaxis protein CheY